MAGKKLSTPDVYQSEKDISEITSPAGTNVGGLVGCFSKGPANRPVLVTSDKDFIENFGQPVLSAGNPIYGYGAYAALQFLTESDALYVIRATNPSEDFYANAGISSTCTLYPINNIGASAGPVPDRRDSIYAIENAPLSGANMVVACNNPGAWGNDIAITLESVTSASDWLFSYENLPVGVEMSAVATSAMNIASQVFKINVYKKESTDNWNNFYIFQNGTSALAIDPVETFLGSLENITDGNNNQLYIKDVVNNSSKYIYVDVNTNHTNFSQARYPYAVTSAGETIGVKSEALIQLSNGASVAKTGIGTYYQSWEYFKDDEDYDISILILPDYSTNVKQAVAQNVVNYRKDCMLVCQAGTLNDVTVSQVLSAEKYGYVGDSSSYVASYAGWGKVYDKYNSKNIYLPLCIYGASVMAATDPVWQSVAGQNRAVVPFIDQNVIWSKAEISQLVDRNINVTRKFNGIGFCIWLSRTCLLRKSKLQQISIRRTLNFLKKTLKRSLMQYVLDVNNNSKTRLRIWSNIDGFLGSVKAREGLNNYEIICNETNNNQYVIDNNELNVDIYVDFPSPIERINLQYIVTRTGVNFNEVRVA